MRDVPFALKPVSIVTIVFGLLGLMSGGLGVVGLLMAPKTVSELPASTPQEEYQRRVYKTAARVRPIQLVLVPALLLSSAALIAAGVSGLKLQGLGFIKAAIAAALVLDSVSSGLGIFVHLKNMENMKWFMKELAAGKSGSEPAIIGMEVGLQMGLFFAVGWLVARTGFYVATLVFLSKRPVREAFSPPVSSEPPPTPGPAGGAS